MTQETKLGLVIGGLFIVCFALILSNMQDEHAMEKQIAKLTEVSPSQPDAKPLAVYGRLSPQLIGYSRDSGLSSTRSQQEDAPPASPAVTNDVADERLSTTPSGQKVIAQREDPVDITKRQSPLPINHPQAPPVTDAIANRPLVPAQPEQHEVRDTSESEIRVNRDGPPPISGPARMQYIVVPNDNLTKITRKFYGSATQDNLNRLFRANRTRLKDPHTLRVGQKLVIPLDDVSLAAAGEEPSARSGAIAVGAASSSSTPDAGNARSHEPPWHWYQVKKGDRYTKIAKTLLGDAKRWKEIHELNRKIFPNPDLIRPGVRIKIPDNS